MFLCVTKRLLTLFLERLSCSLYENDWDGFLHLIAPAFDKSVLRSIREVMENWIPEKLSSAQRVPLPLSPAPPSLHIKEKLICVGVRGTVPWDTGLQPWLPGEMGLGAPGGRWQPWAEVMLVPSEPGQFIKCWCQTLHNDWQYIRQWLLYAPGSQPAPNGHRAQARNKPFFL